MPLLATLVISKLYDQDVFWQAFVGIDFDISGDKFA
jgi:hypothetical protein